MLSTRRVYYSLVLASLSITISRIVSTSASGSGLKRIIMAKQVYENIKTSEARLPASIRPVHYDLRLKPNFHDFTFDGRVSIKYQTDSGQDVPKKIVLNANNLKITSGSLVSSHGQNQLTSVTYNNESETASLEFDGDIKPEGTINLDYTGTLNDKMKGFYRTSFEIDGVKVHAATTKFEPTDARQCLPCWDEPAIKATFSVTLVIEKYIDVKGQKYEQVPLSNMPEISRTGPDSELEVKFDKTPLMSTYLLACIVGPFQMIESVQNGSRPIRVYTTPGKQEQGRFALDVASKSLPFYEDYFGIAYPLPKMDLIAIPDFISGAMENWGLVTYRETTLLVDTNNTTTARRQFVAIVVAHELAHQWFGNLVTMEWWTHLWLNEGFASFMEYLCVDHIYPEWDIWSQFVADDYANALALDSLHNSHPIEVPVKHPSEIGEIFDIISYNKGSSVLRMLHTYLGDGDFRKGMKDYLTKFAYMNTQTEDLWDCLGAASNKPVRQLMHGWTAQMGYPWLSIEYTKDAANNVKLRLTQNKFSADGKLSKEEEAATWMIPISVVVDGQKPAEGKQVTLLEGKSTEVTIEGAGNSWVKLNPGTIGLYRSAYPDEMLNKLLPAISSQSLAPMDRLGIQCDYYALCQSGNVSTSKLLSLLEAYKSETSYPVWQSIDDALRRLSVITLTADFRAQFQAYGRELLSEIFQKLSWSTSAGEHDDVAMTRALVVNRLIAFGDQKVIDEANQMFKAHVAKSSLIPADLRGAVYRAASAYGDEETFESLFTIYRSVSLQEEKDRIAMALGFTRDEARRKRVIEFVLSSEVRNQDKPFAIHSLCATSPESGWQLLKDNKDWFRENYGTGHLIRRVVKFATDNFASHEKADEVKRFFEENEFPGCERTIQQALETMRSNADWLKRDADSIRSFLAVKYKSS